MAQSSSDGELQQWYANEVGATLSMVDVGGGITLEVATAGNPTDPLVVCYHGFPSAACMLYKHQIKFIADLGYHVAVPCLRGFGHSSAPMGVKNYSAIEVGADIVGLVQALGHSECIAVAHDWGALQCWHHAILYPDIIKALFIVSIPCWEGCPRIGPGSTMDPLSFARQLYRTGEEDEAFWYLNYHNYDYVHTIGRPEDEYDGDPEMVFRKMIGGPSRAKVKPEEMVYDASPAISPMATAPSDSPEDTGWFARFPLSEEFQRGCFVTPNDKKYWLAQFKHSGFTHPLDYYRNVERNWRDFEPYVEENSPRQILQPCSWIGGGADGCSASNSWQGWLTPAGWDGKDPAVWQDAMRAIVPNMQELSIVPDVGHWILMEAPEEVNAQLARFLKHPETQAAMAGSRFSRGGGGAGSAAAKL